MYLTYRKTVLRILVCVIFVFLAGCSNGAGNPLIPGSEPEIRSKINSVSQDNRFILGLWSCEIEPGSRKFEITPLRTADITLNINKFVSGSIDGFGIGEIDLSGIDAGRIDCTITIKHPLDGLDEFHLFDVWGVFLHNGSSSLIYDPSSPTYPGGPDAGENEAVLLNADGYTRWFNQPEFDGDGPPFLEYYPMGFSNLPVPTACLNGYKIFTDTLLKNVDYYTWATTPDYMNLRNIFRAGVPNSRRYEFQFPVIDDVPVIQFQFAVITNWEPGDPALTGNPSEYEPWDFPSSANVEEAFFVNVSTVASSLYYDISGTEPDFGGNFIADIEVFDWQGGTVGGNGVLNEIERLIIEADFIDPVGFMEITHAELEAMAFPGTENSSVVQIEIPDCSPKASGDNMLWVIVESAGLHGDSYDQGVATEFPEGVRRSAYCRSTIYISPEAPFVNTLPEINMIEDDVAGPGAYKDPISTDYTAVTYSVVFFDPDVDQTHEIIWWIVEDGTLPTPAGIIDMPIDWSTYDVGDYDIYVTVDDGYGPVQGGPYGITNEEGIIPEWSEPVLIDYSSCMPRAVENWDNELVLIYHKEHNGVMYSINTGDTWSEPETAYYWTDGADKETAPTYLSITRGESGQTVYGSFRGWAYDEWSFYERDRHAIRWTGDTEKWDFTYLWGETNLETLLLPDDDDSFLNIYTFHSMGDPGPQLRGSDRAYWAEHEHDPGLLPVYDEWSCTISNCNAAVRDENNHYIVYNRTMGGMAARTVRVSKTDILDHEEFTIYQGITGETVDSVTLTMDSSGILHAAWKVSDDDHLRIDYAKSTDNGATWTDPQTAMIEYDYFWGFLENHVGIVTDSMNRIYITYAMGIYLYMVTSIDGVTWSAPESPYTGPLPLGYHHTQPYPVMTSDDVLHLFYINKNEIFQFGGILEVTYG